MRVTVDLEICRGHGRCYMLCPEVYNEDDEGYCVIENAEVPEALRKSARRGADNCPEHAITVED